MQLQWRCLHEQKQAEGLQIGCTSEGTEEQLERDITRMSWSSGIRGIGVYWIEPAMSLSNRSHAVQLGGGRPTYAPATPGISPEDPPGLYDVVRRVVGIILGRRVCSTWGGPGYVPGVWRCRLAWLALTGIL